MSYDLTIRSDDAFSQSAEVKSVAGFIKEIPHVHDNGDRSFIFNDGTRYMEIDLEVVNQDGDNIEEYGEEYHEINCVAMHIPYSALGHTHDRDYFFHAHAIARHLGWKLFDPQRGDYLAIQQADATNGDSPN